MKYVDENSKSHTPYLVLALVLLSSSFFSHARVFLPEAAVTEGDYNNKTNYSIFYSGACAQKVGVSIGFYSKKSVSSSINKIYQYAENSVKHILDQCPIAEHIYANVSAVSRKLTDKYVFELHKSDSWRATHKETAKDKFDRTNNKLLAPISLLNQPGFIGIADDQLRAVYGRTLVNQFKSTKIVKKTYEANNEQRFSYYSVIGKWFELGGEKKGQHCENSSEGYAYWGSFSVRIGTGQYANLVKKSCTSLADKGASITSTLTALMGHREYAGYDSVNPNRDFRLLINELDTLNLQSSSGKDQQFTKTRKPIYQNKHIKIYPSSEDWCWSPELDAVYEAKHEERDKYFNGNYISFIGQTGRKLVSEYCGEPLHVKVHNFRLGNKKAWDTMSFLLKPFKPTITTNTTNYVYLDGHKMSDGALADQKLKVWGRSCSGPFCDLHGGLYLNAIYNNDVELIKSLDQIVNTKLQKSVKQRSNALLGKQGTKLFKQAFEKLSSLRNGGKATKTDLLTPSQVSLLESIADYYMYNPRGFNPFSMICKEQLVTKVKSYTTPTYDTFDYQGMYDGQGGGERYSTTYNVKPNFSGLCDRVCSHLGGDQSPKVGFLRSSNKSVRFTLDSTIDLRSKPKYCEEPELKKNIAQFERNLISLTNKFLDNKSSWSSGVSAASVKTINYKSDSVRMFMASNSTKPNVMVTANGLQYILIKTGQGRHPKSGEMVTIYYKGSLASSGRVIAQKWVSSPSTISTNKLLKGMSEGIQLLKPGGRIKIFVPPELGFGDSANGVINKDSVLIYEIELLSSPNSPSHIGEAYEIKSKSVIKKIERIPSNLTPKKTVIPTFPTTQEKLVKPIKIVKRPVVVRPKLLASEDRHLTNIFQFGADVVLDNTVIDFLVLKLTSKQLDKNTWTAMMASRWNYERSQENPVGGRFFHPKAKDFSAKDIDNIMQQFQQWMLEQAAKLPENLTISAAVFVAKLGSNIHAVPSDGCAILDEKSTFTQHQYKLVNAVSQAVMPGVQTCQQQMKADVGQIINCMQTHASDPNFCRQQMQNKLKQCMENSSNNMPDTWEKISVNWVKSDFNVHQCKGHSAFGRDRRLRNIRLGVGSVELLPSNLSIKINFDKTYELPAVKKGLFALDKSYEEGIAEIKFKSNSGNLKSESGKSGLILEIVATMIGLEYKNK